MQSQYRATSFRKTQIVIFCIMLFCAWLPVSNALSMAHQPVSFQFHNPLDVSDYEKDEIVQKLQSAGHSHGHVSFDHTHDLPQWFTINSNLSITSHSLWLRAAQAELDSVFISPAKKPPKFQFIA
ncbi:hypothetical protein [Chitinibacter sp. S2-10]|uniref:hypothetical protein n=1 Tax=Chitinibacter sp. S2-10 TaxID=3373597 RepID=UPI00397765AC